MPETTITTKARHSRSGWEQLMMQYEASGLKQRAFCNQHGFPLCQDSCRVHIIEKKSSRRRQEREECRSTVKSSKSKWYER